MNYLFFADGFEEIEALTVVDVLRRAELPVEMVSLNADLQVRGAHGVTVVCDRLLVDVQSTADGYLILPGGMPGAQHLSESRQLADLLTAHHRQQRPLAAICAAPFVLGQLGILEGEHATCYPGFEEHLHGATVLPDGVVQSHHIVTAKGPAFALDFALTLVANLRGRACADNIRRGMLIA